METAINIVYTINKTAVPTTLDFKLLEFYQVNLWNLLDYVNVLISQIQNQFYSSNSNMKTIIQTMMIVLIVGLFVIKLCEYFLLSRFMDRIVKIINIFLRVSQNDAYNEIILCKEMLHILKDPSDSYLNLNCSEKVVNKKSIKINEESSILIGNSRISKKEKLKSSSYQMKIKKNVSFHNMKKFSKFYSILLILFLFIFIFGYLILNFFYYELINSQIDQLITIYIFFGKLNIVPPTTIAFDRILIREKIVTNLLYQYPDQDSRKINMYNLYMQKITELNQLSGELNTYGNSDLLNNQLIKQMIYGDKGNGICQALYTQGIFPIDEMNLCGTVINGAFNGGFLNVLTALKVSLLEEDAITKPIPSSQPDLVAAQQQNAHLNLQSTAGLQRILSEYILLISLPLLNSLIKLYYSDLMFSYMQNLQSIVLSTTILFGVILILINYCTYRYFRKFYRNIVMILNVIPYEKLLHDEQTIFLIKKYWRE